MTTEAEARARHIALLRGKRKRHNRFAIWWHFTMLHHNQWQWNVKRPVSVGVIHKEALLCSCGSNWNGSWR